MIKQEKVKMHVANHLRVINSPQVSRNGLWLSTLTGGALGCLVQSASTLIEPYNQFFTVVKQLVGQNFSAIGFVPTDGRREMLN